MVHPSYAGIGVLTLAIIGCQLRLWGRELPPELFWNRRRIYENFKPLADSAGYCQAVQGMDWHYLPTVGSDDLHASAAHGTAAVFFQEYSLARSRPFAMRSPRSTFPDTTRSNASAIESTLWGSTRRAASPTTSGMEVT